jgi:hypothetical protein
LTGWKVPDNLEVLAAAYAERGDFDKAVRWQEKALMDPVYAKQNRDRASDMLKLYAAKQPYRVKE